jgi:hypothetical protein
MTLREESVRMSSEHVAIDESSELVNRVIHGDKRALAELFDTQRPRLRRIVNFRLDRRIYGRVGADDVLQEAFMNACGQLKALLRDHPPTVFIWLRQIVVIWERKSGRPNAIFRCTPVDRPPRRPNGWRFICSAT